LGAEGVGFEPTMGLSTP